MSARIVAVLVALAMLAYIFTPMLAHADCSMTSVCSRYGSRQVCRTEQRCSAPRVRSCRFVDRCTPQRTCVYRNGYSSCVTRDVCRRIEVCS